jgi:DNA-binding SARP family transcriptional activator
MLILRRGFVRAALVIGLAALALAIALPFPAVFTTGIYGTFGFRADQDNRVFMASPDASRAGINIGDIIDYRSMPFDSGYLGGFRRPLPGVRVTFRVIHHGVARDVTRVAVRQVWPPWWRNSLFLTLLVDRAAGLILALAGVALVLLRPTRITAAFYIYAVGSASGRAAGYSFLPMPWFLALVAVNDVFDPAAPFGFLLVALRLSGDPPTGWRRTVEAAAPYLFALLVLSVVAGDLSSVLFDLPTQMLGDAGQYAEVGLIVIGIVSLTLRLLDRRRKTPLAVRFAMTGLAIAGLAAAAPTILWRLPHPPWTSVPLRFMTLTTLPYVFDLIASLMVAYVLVRYRIVDLRGVIRRSLAYGALAGSIVVAVMALNFAFAKQWAQFALAIPLEIVAAVALGYRLSGLGIVATTLSLVQIDAPAASARGRRGEEREILARALDRAERARRLGLVAEVRARAAFSAWLAGEDDEYERQLAALEASIGDGPMRGLGFFVAAARGRLDGRKPAPSELREWVASGYLVACGTSDDAAAARRYATSAVDAADASEMPLLRVLARVASAEFSPLDREHLLEKAAEISAQSDSVPLQQAVSALRANRDDLGALAAFVERRLRSVRVAIPILDVRFLTATVFSSGSIATLREGERALLFAIARNREAANADRLVDALWPELDGDAAANAFRVCLHRLRKGLGNTRAVVRSSRGYTLCPGAVVDIWSVADTIAGMRLRSTLELQDRTTLQGAHARLRAGRKARAGQPAWFSPYAAELAELSHEAARMLARDALQRGDVIGALYVVQLMIQDEPADESACELAIRAHLAGGDRAAALRELRRYRNVLAASGDNHNPALLEALVQTPST